MREIKLTQGKVAMVDDECFEIVNKYHWYYHKVSENYGAARSSLGRRGPSEAMHRLVMGAAKGQEVDHINGNPLDNRKSNLRFVTHAQNQKNMGKGVRNKSGYKGVSWHKRAKKWQVFVNSTYLGLFSDLEEATKAYNIKALELFGEFARLNKIKD
jgi:hypothetical protein